MIDSSFQTLDTTMSILIQQYRDDASVGFAHSISSDFEHPHMTAGIAVVFRKNFGTPSRHHHLTNHLVIQSNRYGASVYSLITKGRHFENPEILDYNTTFRHLTHDFQKKGLKHLICPPIGCVRDKVQLTTFISNLKNFRQLQKQK